MIGEQPHSLSTAVSTPRPVRRCLIAVQVPQVPQDHSPAFGFPVLSLRAGWGGCTSRLSRPPPPPRLSPIPREAVLSPPALSHHFAEDVREDLLAGSRPLSKSEAEHRTHTHSNRRSLSPPSGRPNPAQHLYVRRRAWQPELPPPLASRAPGQHCPKGALGMGLLKRIHSIKEKQNHISGAQ